MEQQAFKASNTTVLAILDTANLEPIAATIACHCMWKTKKNVTKAKLINKLIADAKKDDDEIKAKQAATKKKVAGKRKATVEMTKALATRRRLRVGRLTLLNNN